MPVAFSSQKEKFSLPQKNKISGWLNVIAFTESREIDHIEFLFCDDAYMLNVNREHLKHDFYTDIITFDYSSRSKISGDILISIDRVKDNAKAFSASFQQELLRVIAHGVLHLCGYKDKKKADEQEMRRKEEECLQLWTDMK